MKKILCPLALVAALLPGTAAAEGVWSLQGVEYKVDTLQHYRVGPGTTMTVVDLDGPVKQRVWYSTTDLTDPDVVLKTYNPSNIRTGNTTVPNMVKNREGDGFVYFVGVNADLFSTNGPIGTTIMDGEIIKTAKESTAWKAVGFDDNKQVLGFGAVKMNFGATLNGVQEYAPSLVNVPRAANETIIYTRRWGSSTGTTAGETGLEILLRPEGGILRSDGPTECTVVSAPVKDGGNMAISDGCIVLSTTIASHIRDLGLMKAGDKYVLQPSSVSVSTDNYNNYTFGKCTQLIGGDPLLLVNGATLGSYATMPNYNSRRPRTALGTDASRSKMILLVVDGDSYNKGISAGVDAQDLAAMMLAVGCTDAINFDGGGSSCIYTHADGVLNRPSDGSNRAVRNGLFVATADSGDNAVASIAFADPHITLELGDSYTPVFYSYNSKGLLLSKNVPDVKLYAPEGLGTVSADGKTLTVTGDGTYRLEARLGALSCHIAVRAGDYTANAGMAAVAVADNAPASYFNLQGMPVQNPGKGMYIQRSANGTAQIIMNR